MKFIHKIYAKGKLSEEFPYPFTAWSRCTNCLKLHTSLIEAYIHLHYLFDFGIWRDSPYDFISALSTFFVGGRRCIHQKKMREHWCAQRLPPFERIEWHMERGLEQYRAIHLYDARIVALFGTIALVQSELITNFEVPIYYLVGFHKFAVCFDSCSQRECRNSLTLWTCQTSYHLHCRCHLHMVGCCSPHSTTNAH